MNHFFPLIYLSTMMQIYLHVYDMISCAIHSPLTHYFFVYNQLSWNTQQSVNRLLLTLDNVIFVLQLFLSESF